MTIWKFPLVIDDRQEVEVPDGARFLSIQTQNGLPCMWLAVDPKAAKTKVALRCFGTGHKLPIGWDHWVFLGTVQTGQFVWHYFVEAGL
jgi:hypothetical protein